jgi:hypothetical protein
MFIRIYTGPYPKPPESRTNPNSLGSLTLKRSLMRQQQMSLDPILSHLKPVHFLFRSDLLEHEHLFIAVFTVAAEPYPESPEPSQRPTSFRSLGTRRFSIVTTRARHRTLPWDTCIQFISYFIKMHLRQVWEAGMAQSV